MYDNILEVRAVAGDNFLGGEDFTEVLYQLFLKRRGLEEETLSLKTRLYLKKQAELCKLCFSEERSSVMRCVMDGGAVSETQY